MYFPTNTTLNEIALLLKANFVGNPNKIIPGMNEIHSVNPGDLVFVDHPKYYDKVLNSDAGVILINKKVTPPDGKAIIISENPFRDFNVLTAHFNPFKPATSAIASTARIGKNTTVQPNCFIGNNVIIGNDCIIHANTCINDDTVIGNEVIINSGTVIGSDAFYYKKNGSGYNRLLSGGKVVIEDRVEIGALCTIDRGVSGDTVIGAGTKLDNQVQVGHDTRIGKQCLIVSQVGIAGCVVIKDNVTIWGQVGIISDVVIGENVTILAQSGVGKSLPPNGKYFGSPTEEYREKLREIAAIRKLKTYFKNKNI